MISQQFICKTVALNMRQFRVDRKSTHKGW